MNFLFPFPSPFFSPSSPPTHSSHGEGASHYEGEAPYRTLLPLSFSPPDSSSLPRGRFFSSSASRTLSLRRRRSTLPFIVSFPSHPASSPCGTSDFTCTQRAQAHPFPLFFIHSFSPRFPSLMLFFHSSFVGISAMTVRCMIVLSPPYAPFHPSFFPPQIFSSFSRSRPPLFIFPLLPRDPSQQTAISSFCFFFPPLPVTNKDGNQPLSPLERFIFCALFPPSRATRREMLRIPFPPFTLFFFPPS